MRRHRTQLSLFLLVVTGCSPGETSRGSPSGVSPSAIASTAASGLGSSSAVALPVATPEPSDPAAPWAAVAKGLKITKASPPAAPLVYPPRPTCPLRYASDALATMKQEPATTPDRALSFYLETEVEVSGTAEGWALKPVSLVTGIATTEGRAPPGGMAFDEARVTSQGATLSAVGDAPLWNGMNSFSGFAVFFPGLPATAPGSSREWIVSWLTSGAPEVRSRLGLTFDERISVQLDEWIAVNGVPAAVLTARSSGEIPDTFHALSEALSVPDAPTGVSNAGSYALRARYVVLASGRLLHARVERATRVVIARDGTPVSKQLHQTWLELRLTQACDGPVLPQFERAASGETLAFAAMKRLRDAAVGRNQAALLETLSPRLLARHGKDKIAALLIAHVDRYGPLSLGTPEMPIRVEHDRGEIEVRLSGSAVKLEGSANPFSIDVRIRARAAGDRYEITSIKSGGTRSGRPVLEVDDKKLHSLASVDPKPK